MKTIDDIGKAMAADRLWIPECNRKKFDQEAESYFAEMKIANAQRLENLLEDWKARVDWLKNNQRAFTAPPLLCQHVGESKENYWKRCYKAMGGYYAE